MKPELAVIFGQAPELSTTFQTGELCRHLEQWFSICRFELPPGRGCVHQMARLWRNYLSPALRAPKHEFILYGNDGFADLTRWRGHRVLYWYDASADWSVEPPRNFKDRLRMRNVLAADDVFAVSAAQVHLAKSLRPNRKASVHYLPVGVDCEFFDPAKANGAAVRKRLGIQPTEIIIGYLGYLGRWQNRFAGEALIEATRYLTNPTIKYLVVGSGPALSDWREKARTSGILDRFIFTGFVPQTELPSFIAAMDICVDTLEPGFHSEARSETKLKQYMAMGRACVATDIGENRVDLDCGAAGALCTPDPSALAESIQRLSADPKERTRLGIVARQRAKTGYNWPVLARQMARKLNILRSE